MKYRLLLIPVVLLMLNGCARTASIPETQTTVSTQPETEPPTSENPPADYEEQYSGAIDGYCIALSEAWQEDHFYRQGRSPMGVYAGDGLRQSGYALLDLDGDGAKELLLGLADCGERSPLLYEVWTLEAGEPKLLAASRPRERYYLAQRGGAYYLAREGGAGNARSAWYLFRLEGGQLALEQGVVYDGVLRPNNPWHETWDLDFDVSNDYPIETARAEALLQEARGSYICPEYTVLADRSVS